MRILLLGLCFLLTFTFVGHPTSRQVQLPPFSLEHYISFGNELGMDTSRSHYSMILNNDIRIILPTLNNIKKLYFRVGLSILSSSDYLQNINHKNNPLLLYNLGFGKEYNLMLDSEYIFREIEATLEAMLRTNGILLNVYTLRESNTESLQSFLDLITILCVMN